MENEIKVNEFVRTRYGEIAKVIEFKDELILDAEIKFYGMYRKHLNDDELDFIVKHSPNLIDLIECGDYVNGYKVTNVINKEPCPSGKCVDIDADRPSEYCTLWEDNIETVVTKEQFESISYKVTKM